MIEDKELDKEYYKKNELNNGLTIFNEAEWPLLRELREKRFVNGTVELLHTNFKLNPFNPYISVFNREANKAYIEKELKWYLSKDLSINGHVDDVKIWQQCASKDDKKLINSNYGWCIFSEENHSQYESSLAQLRADKGTRCATMIYTRPSIQTEATENGKRDMICTFNTHQLIRNNRLVYLVNMRSNDAIFGFLNDFAWHCYVYQMMFEELKKDYPDLQPGYINWNASSFHVYERHFKLMEDSRVRSTCMNDILS